MSRSPTDFLASSWDRAVAYAWDLGFASAVLLLIYGLLDTIGVRADLASLVALVLFGYHAGFLITRAGVSPGKAIRNICVVGSDGSPPTPAQAAVRSLVTTLPYWALASGDIDFDVVAHGLDALIPTVGVGLLLADILLLEYTRQRRTTADRAARTMVLNLPPMQPHRAPAGPMYSADDAEFGKPPRRVDRD